MVKTLLPLVGLAILLVGCGTPTKFGEAPLTKSEERLLAEIDPSAATVRQISDFVFDVSHPRVPSGTQHEIVGLLFGEERRSEMLFTMAKRYLFVLEIYEVSAIKTCQRFNKWPDRGSTIGLHTRRFSCLKPLEWVRSEATSEVEDCKFWLKDSNPELRRQFYVFQKEHPCDPRLKRAPPAEFCNAYSRVIGFNPGETVSCSGLTDLVARAKFQEELQPSEPPTTPNISIDDSKAKCAELGFRSGTEKFGDCVLKLSK